MRNKAADDAAWMEAIMRGPLGNCAPFEDWCSQAHAIRGWSRATFKRRLQVFKKRRPELTGGRFQGDPYSLPTQPTGAMAMVERMASLRTPGRLAFVQRANLAEPGREPEPGSAGLSLVEQALHHARLKGQPR
jgi:hypothetical protein